MAQETTRIAAPKRNIESDPTANMGLDRLLEAGATVFDSLTGFDIRIGALAARHQIRLGDESLNATFSNPCNTGMLSLRLLDAKEKFKGAIQICNNLRENDSVIGLEGRRRQFNPLVQMRIISKAFLEGEFAGPLKALVERGRELRTADNSAANEALRRELGRDTELFIWNIAQPINRLAADPWRNGSENVSSKHFDIARRSLDGLLRVEGALAALEILTPFFNEGDLRQRALASEALRSLIAGKPMHGEGESSLDLFGFVDGALYSNRGIARCDDVMIKRRKYWVSCERMLPLVSDNPSMLNDSFILLRNRAGQNPRRFAPPVSAWDAIIVNNIHKPFIEALVKTYNSELNALGIVTFNAGFNLSFKIAAGPEELAYRKREVLR